mgnify:CR=1 FL=1
MKFGMNRLVRVAFNLSMHLLSKQCLFVFLGEYSFQYYGLLCILIFVQVRTNEYWFFRNCVRVVEGTE